MLFDRLFKKTIKYIPPPKGSLPKGSLFNHLFKKTIKYIPPPKGSLFIPVKISLRI